MNKGTFGEIIPGKGNFGKCAFGISFLLSLMLFSFVNIHSLGRYIIDEPLVQGEFREAFFTVRNTQARNLEDVSVKLIIYDLGLQYTSMPFDVSRRDSNTAMVNIRAPYGLPEGEYLAKVTASNDKFRDTQHVMVRII
ncbi:hypothetical protein HYU13_00375 [Candidatus Woesearchaeota archaeon]|nr:hypothetical protein [Candidatus Woesearchaeota archaeon]